MTRRMNTAPSNPNSSNPINIEVIGQFVTPQNTAVMPRAAHREGEIPMRLPNRQPKVAPVQNAGTISPPLNPAASVRDVNSIFRRKA